MPEQNVRVVKRFMHVVLMKQAVGRIGRIVISHDVGLRFAFSLIVVSLLRRLRGFSPIEVIVFDEGLALNDNERLLASSRDSRFTLAELRFAEPNALSRPLIRIVPRVARIFGYRFAPTFGPIAWLTGFSHWTVEAWVTRIYAHVPREVRQHILPPLFDDEAALNYFDDFANDFPNESAHDGLREESVLVLGAHLRPSYRDLESVMRGHPGARLYLKPHPVRDLSLEGLSVEGAAWSLFHRCVPAEAVLQWFVGLGGRRVLYHWNSAAVWHLTRELHSDEVAGLEIRSLANAEA